MQAQHHYFANGVYYDCEPFDPHVIVAQQANGPWREQL
jgi:hypothetical protein